jgi:hypothetical protein
MVRMHQILTFFASPSRTSNQTGGYFQFGLRVLSRSFVVINKGIAGCCRDHSVVA